MVRGGRGSDMCLGIKSNPGNFWTPFESKGGWELRKSFLPANSTAALEIVLVTGSLPFTGHLSHAHARIPNYLDSVLI